MVETLFCQYDKLMQYGISFASLTSVANFFKNILKVSDVRPCISMARGLNSTPTCLYAWKYLLFLRSSEVRNIYKYIHVVH